MQLLIKEGGFYFARLGFTEAKIEVDQILKEKALFHITEGRYAEEYFHYPLIELEPMILAVRND